MVQGRRWHVQWCVGDGTGWETAQGWRGVGGSMGDGVGKGHLEMMQARWQGKRQHGR